MSGGLKFWEIVLDISIVALKDCVVMETFLWISAKQYSKSGNVWRMEKKEKKL